MMFEKKHPIVDLEFNLFEILACPQCHSALHRAADELVCTGCAEHYPVRNGVPLFVQYAQTPEFMPQYESIDSVIRKRFGERVHRILWEFNRFPVKVTTESRDIVTKLLTQLIPRTARILNLGSGQFIQDWALFREHRTRVVNLDIVPFSGTHIAADAHQLPFFGDTFDLVYMSCVLEHVRDASIVVEECYRVLRPEGYVYSTTPFVSRFHSDSDYRRWTPMGLDYLFQDFEKVANGVHCGPGSAVALALREFIPLLFGSGYLHFAVKFLAGWLLVPLAYLDLLLVRNPRAYKLAQSLFFLGQKKTRP
jgi:SAM-dependent methyltransferase/uncharacterized protein YbaR (Trm112 family)